MSDNSGADRHPPLMDDKAAVAFAKPEQLFLDKGLSPAAAAALLKPVDAFYGFWNNTSQTLLDEALSPDFVDRALPPGRPQGPTGPMAAAVKRLAAIPDVRIAVVQRIVAGDRVVSQLHFTGHFTGTWEGTKGAGQAIDFLAIDILAVRDGRITDNWHLEDNIAMQTQMGLMK